MLRRFKELYPFLEKLEIKELYYLVAKTGSLKKPDFLLEHLEKVDFVTKYLHRDEVTLADARALFNWTVETLIIP